MEQPLKNDPRAFYGADLEAIQKLESDLPELCTTFVRIIVHSEIGYHLGRSQRDGTHRRRRVGETNPRTVSQRRLLHWRSHRKSPS